MRLEVYSCLIQVFFPSLLALLLKFGIHVNIDSETKLELPFLPKFLYVDVEGQQCLPSFTRPASTLLSNLGKVEPPPLWFSY